MPVGRRPPCVKISHRPGAACLASMATTIHWLPNFSAASRDERAAVNGRRHDRDLVGPGEQELANVLDRPDAAADRQRHETGLGRAAHDVEEDAAVFVARGNVEKAQFVGAGLVIGDRARHRIAGVAQVDEIDALDDAAVLDVETGDEAELEHHSAAVSTFSAGRASLMNDQALVGSQPCR